MNEVCITEVRERLCDLREWAKLNESRLMALVLSGTKRKKRRFALCDYGTRCCFLFRKGEGIGSPREGADA